MGQRAAGIRFGYNHSTPNLRPLHAAHASLEPPVASAAEQQHCSTVTPAAISHQIKALESDLGVLLFRRLNRALLLTEAGQRLLPGIRDGFAGL